MKVELSSVQRLYDLTEQEYDKIREDLTLPNPNYAKAKKYSGYSTVKVPKYIRYYKDKAEYLEIPIGYRIPFEYEVVKDDRVDLDVEYPPIKVELRDAQQRAFDSYIEDTSKGLISLQTGMGKSILGIYTACKLKKKTLVIVHKSDLVTGWKRDIEMCFDKALEVGIIKASKRKIGEQITVATIQTLSRMSVSEIGNYLNAFSMVIVDECHLVSASTFEMVEKFNAKYKIGLTATPERNDGLDRVITLRVGDLVYRHELEDGDTDILPVDVIVKNIPLAYEPTFIEEVVKGRPKLVPFNRRVHSPDLAIPLSQIDGRPKLSYHAIDDDLVSHPLYVSQYTQDILSEYNKGHSIIVFLNQKEHCRELKTVLETKGVTPTDIQLYYGDATDNKEDMLKRAEEIRRTITIATYSIAKEGTNVKQWEVAFLLSSINNGLGLEQAIGRIRRSLKDKPKLDKVRVYDYRFPKAVAVSKHGSTRDARYRKLKFSILKDGVKSKGGLFSRGY